VKGYLQSRAAWFLAAMLALLAIAGVLSAQPSGADFPEEAAQAAYLEAMKLYDGQQFDKALKKLDEAANAAKKLPDKTWRANVTKTVKEARLGVLYEAGLTSFRKDAYESSYGYFDKCLAEMPKGDKRRPSVQRSMVKSSYMLTMQLWLARKYDKARESARKAQSIAQVAYPQGSIERERLDAVHYKVTMEGTDEMVARGEIDRAFSELKKDFELQADPRFAYLLGELGTQLRAYSEAERYYMAARDGAKGRTGEEELAALVAQSEEKLVQIKTLRQTVVVKSNVPFYQVEIYRPFREAPLATQQPDDPAKGARFELYPGKYRIQVVNPDFGACVRDDVPVRNTELELECAFEKPPTAVSIDTTPSGVKVRVVPSSMVAFRRTPFYTELYRGSYTLLVEMDDFPGTIEVPFVVEGEGTQDFHFDLDYAELDVQLPADQADASIRVDGRPAPSTPDGTVKVGIGSHLVEVIKPGYEPARQRIFFKPRETKSYIVSLVAVKTDDLSGRGQSSAVELSLAYGARGAAYQVTGRPAGAVAESTIDASYVMHSVDVGSRIFLTRDGEATAKWYLPIDLGVQFAVSSPIQAVFTFDALVGAGVQFDRIAKSKWNLEFGYRLSLSSWDDQFTDTRHQLSTLQPLGAFVRGGGHWDMLHLGLNFGYTQGTGRRDDFAFVSSTDGVRGCSTDTTLSWLETTASVGVDLVDAFGYRPDIDAVLGGFGGVLMYSEEQRSRRNGGSQCNERGTESFDRTDPRAGAQFKFRYATGTAIRTGFFLNADLFVLGGLLPQAPVIYDDKTGVDPSFGNFRVSLGMDLGF
jgi:hypothetical protein